jgi:hypothetical protein
MSGIGSGICKTLVRAVVVVLVLVVDAAPTKAYSDRRKVVQRREPHKPIHGTVSKVGATLTIDN